MLLLFLAKISAGLISQILPQVLVKGKEYAVHEIAGSDTVLENGGIVETLELVSGASTSEIITRIKELD